jgi:hypothetical protein
MKRKNDSGQALVEIAISLSIFLLLAMGTVDFAFLFNHKLTLQNAVRQAGRYAITGQCLDGSNGTCSRYNGIISTLEAASDGFINPGNVNSVVTISCINEGGGCPNPAGGPQDLVTIQVAYPYNFITPLIAPFFRNQPLTINVGATFTNEPFPPGES